MTNTVPKSVSDKRLLNLTGGSRKGIPNKLSRTARENIEKAYSLLGSVQGHVKFLKSHPRALAEFYARVYPLLLAIKMEHSGPGGGPLKFVYGNGNGNGNGEGNA